LVYDDACPESHFDMDELPTEKSDPKGPLHSPGEVTQLLVEWNQGDASAIDRLLLIVYAELHRVADNYLRRERPGHTLQATALINEAYLRLVGAQNVQWQNREQFFGISANLMRRVLVDHARGAKASKRGGSLQNLPLDEATLLIQERDENLLLLDEALERLTEVDPQACRIVELRYFGGLTIDETAEVLKLSPTTVKREWAAARAFLHREIGGDEDE
jgi:RNA polymerase sigma-70 factor, ECF subfamily